MKKTRTLIAGAILASVLAAPAQADIAARYKTNDENAVMNMEMTVEADNEGNVRTQMAHLGAYFLLSDGELFQVANSESGLFVVRVSDLMRVQGEIAQEMFQNPPPEMDLPKQSFAPMDPEIVSERQGIGYGIVSDDYPEPRYASIVVSDDPALAPLGDAVVRSHQAMASSASAWGSMGTMLGMMNEEMLAVLRKGAPLRLMKLELTDISTEMIPAERFELPAEPLTIEELRARLSPRVEEPPTLPPSED